MAAPADTDKRDKSERDKYDHSDHPLDHRKPGDLQTPGGGPRMPENAPEPVERRA